MLRTRGNFMLNIRCTCIKYRLMDTKNPAFIIKCGVPLQLVLYCPLGNDARKESSILSVHLATTPRFYGELTIPKSPDMLLKFLVTSVASSVASRLGDARPLARLWGRKQGDSSIESVCSLIGDIYVRWHYLKGRKIPSFWFPGEPHIPYLRRFFRLISSEFKGVLKDFHIIPSQSDEVYEIFIKLFLKAIKLLLHLRRESQ